VTKKELRIDVSIIQCYYKNGDKVTGYLTGFSKK